MDSGLDPSGLIGVIPARTMSRKSKTRLVAIAAIIVAVVATILVIRCGSRGERLLLSSIEAMNSLEAYQFQESGGLGWYGGYFKATGAFNAPDQLRRQGTIFSTVHAAEFGMVRLGDTVYAFDPYNAEWGPFGVEPLPGFLLSDARKGPIEALTEVLSAYDSSTVKTTQLDGVPVHHVILTLNYSAQIEWRMQDVNKTLEAWIGNSDLLIRKLEQYTQWGLAESSSWRVEFSGFNDVAAIEIPKERQLISEPSPGLYGPMRLYRGKHTPFAILHPAGGRVQRVTHSPPLEREALHRGRSYHFALDTPEGCVFEVFEEPARVGSLEEYVDGIMERSTNRIIVIPGGPDSDFIVASRETVSLSENVPPAEILEFTQNSQRGLRLIYLHNDTGIVATFRVPAEEFDGVKDKLRYSLLTFRIEDRGS